ncbi:MAG: hypothetical protein HXM95_03360 [Parvimonas micra]|nr:hypothetical protein [Parvimonas micra]
MNIGDLRYRNLVDDLLLINIDKLTANELLELNNNIIKLNTEIGKELIKRNIFVNNDLNNSSKLEFNTRLGEELAKRHYENDDENCWIANMSNFVIYTSFVEGVNFICELLKNFEKEQKVFWKSNENEELLENE